MPTTKELNRLNNAIGLELGRNPWGEPVYKWAYSENLHHWMRADGYDYQADPNSGLIVARPKYEIRKQAPHLDHQWVICKWEAPIPESEWRNQFGYRLEWPKRGEYYPTNVDLDPGVVPNLTLTEAFIEAVKKQRSKTLADHVADGERILERKEHAVDSHLDAVIRDSCTAFGNVPGKKLSTSFPSVGNQPTSQQGEP